ncbi:MAG: glycoside hydrolase family 127 protein [Victivallaceae bacterium]|nr:glycoside hydrolase family 127 protein [Victivallaceae bacterium]
MRLSANTPIGDVVLCDAVLAPRMKQCFSVTIPSALEKCRETGRIDAFKLDWKPGMPRQPHFFWDSDLAKVVEGMAYAMLEAPNPELEKKLTEVVDLIVSAQGPDGYLNTYFTVVEPENRWKSLYVYHELYCAGHLMEAAVAHYQATGKRNFLDCMCRYADYIGTVFGRGENLRRGCPGHEEIELALCRLADASGNPKYAQLAKYFIDERGTEPNVFVEEAKRNHKDLAWPLINHQADRPVRMLTEAAGHAVRALYLYSGMAEVAMRFEDAELLAACRRVYDNLTERRMFITGGVGSNPHGEEITKDYHLPNDYNYAESCASIALAFFSDRMFQATGDGRYLDTLENALFNGILAGIDLKGDRYFYANLLESHPAVLLTGPMQLERQEWFGCSCCPTSFARFLPQIGHYVWEESAEAVSLCIPSPSVWKGRFEVSGDYPAGGSVKITALSSCERTLKLRIPNWCGKFSLRRNGEACVAVPEKGIVSVPGPIAAGEVLELELDMPIRLLYADLHVTNDAGKVVVARGPVLYALESVDNNAPLSRLILDPRKPLEIVKMPEAIASDLPAIRATGYQEEVRADGVLYSEKAPAALPTELLFVPYALWGNRGVSEMTLFVRTLPRI